MSTGGNPAHRATPLLAARIASAASAVRTGESNSGGQVPNNFYPPGDAVIDSAGDSNIRDTVTSGHDDHTTISQRNSVGESTSSMPSHDSRSTGRPKRTLIESACAACRRRKSRCDGIRPTCSRCQTLRTECAYEAEEGESRWSALRRRNQTLETERSELRELLSLIQTRSELEALEIFHRIRNGGYDDAFNILRQIRENDVSANASRASTPTRSLLSLQHAEPTRLPPIRSMFDVSTPIHSAPPIITHPPPPLLTPEHSRGSNSSAGSMDYAKSYPPL